MDAETTRSKLFDPLSVLHVYPPGKLGATYAEQLAERCGATIDVVELAGQPEKCDSFALVGIVNRRPVNFVLLQYGQPGDLWIRRLLVDPTYGIEVARAVLDHARPTRRSRDLVAMAREDDLRSQIELRELGLVCEPPAERTKYQIKRGLYVFRSWNREFAGRPRFTWPRPPWTS